jgi:hypothetical protein
MKTMSLPKSMSDLPDDLTDVGVHRGNQPPTETGQTVRSPEGPDPGASDAQPSPALFQIVRPSTEPRFVVRAHSARAEVEEPEEGDEVGRYRTIDALRETLSEIGIADTVAVFEDVEANRVLVDADLTAEHAWIGQPRYPSIAVFETRDEAEAFAEAHDRPTPGR